MLSKRFINFSARFAFMIILIMAFLLQLLLPCSITGERKFLEKAAAESETEAVDFNTSDVMKDLLHSKIDNKAFTLADYPAVENGGLSFLHLLEVNYKKGSSDNSDYGLFLYLYNPGNIIFDLFSASNTVNIAVAFDENGAAVLYDVFSLKFISRSTDPRCPNRFIKYKILDHISHNDGKNIHSRVNSDLRVYSLSSLKLKNKETGKVEAFNLASVTKYAGYQKGYGSDPELADLASASDIIDTIELEVHQVYYRTGINSTGRGYQSQIDSVYFSVPNRYIRDYGKLQKVLARWLEAYTKLILVTKDPSIKSVAFAKRGNKISSYDASHYRLRTEPPEVTPMFGGDSLYEYDWYYNLNPAVSGFSAVTSVYEQIPYVFYKENLGNVSGSEILNYDYPAGTEYYQVGDKKYSKDLFEKFDSEYTVKNIDVDTDTFDLKSYNSNHDFWDRWRDFGFGVAVKNSDALKEAYENVAPIELVTDTVNSEGASSDYLVDSGYLPELRTAYHNAKSNDQSLFLLRFGVSDYFSEKVSFSESSSALPGYRSGSYVAKEAVYFDFEIIQLSFKKEEVLTVIPVVQSPIDIASDVTPPPDVEPNSIDKIIGDGLENIKKSFSKWFGSLGEKIRDFFVGLWKAKTFRKILIIIASVIGGIILLLVVKLIFLPIKLLASVSKNKKVRSESKYVPRKYKQYKNYKYRN